MRGRGERDTVNIARMSGRSLLVVAQLAPPSSLVAARRVAGLTKYLARRGFRITVLSSAISGAGAIEGAANVVRTADLMASRMNWRRGHFAALTGREDAKYRRPSRLEAAVVPDLAALTWLPFAVPRALSMARRGQFDAVLTTSPPASAHAVGYALQSRGVPWIAELRDGWTFEPPRRPWPTEAQRRADRALESRMLRRAQQVVAVTTPIVADLRERLGVEAALVTNGFDPEAQAASSAAGLLDRDKHAFVHTGRLALSGVSLRSLLDALRLLRREEPVLAHSIVVVFAGPLSAEEHDLLSAKDITALVRAVGSLDHASALGLQRAADTLLVITGGHDRRSVATGKLFEYLAAGRPILVLGDQTEAARIVAETRTGTATSAEDPAEIARALVAAVASPPPERDETALARYAWPSVAEDYARIIERVCRGR